MLDILYLSLIKPLEYLIAVIFSFCMVNICQCPLIDIFYTSFTISIICLPLYKRMEDIKKRDSQLYGYLYNKIEKIKQNFKGDERIFILKTLYRQQNYNPFIASLKNSSYLLLQIPFFLGAYNFFSSGSLPHAMSSWWIFSDLSKPDALLQIAGYSINVLPIIMTLINITSIRISSQATQNTTQQYGLSLLFLILLYNSPSCLVLYWTSNNIIFLYQTVINSICTPEKRTPILITTLALLFAFPIIINNRINLLALFIAVFTSSIIFKNAIQQNIVNIKQSCQLPETFNGYNLLILSACGFILLHGFIIPLNLISSDTLAFIETNFCQLDCLLDTFANNNYSLIGIHLLYAPIIYHVCSTKMKKYYAAAYASLYIYAIWNYFSLDGRLGVVNAIMQFESCASLSGTIFEQITNIVIYFVILYCVIMLCRKHQTKYIYATIAAIIVSSCILSTKYIMEIIQQTRKIMNVLHDHSHDLKEISLSSSNKNVIIIFLDRLSGICFREALKEFPELNKSYSGFVYYPNTVSFYAHTMLGYPPLAGGYEYTPLQLEKNNLPMATKHIQAQCMLPILFQQHQYDSVLIDPIGSMCHAVNVNKGENYWKTFDDNQVNARKLYDFSNDIIQKACSTGLPEAKQLALQQRIFMYSLMCISPMILKLAIYRTHTFTSALLKNVNFVKFHANQQALLSLPHLTTAHDKPSTFVFIHNNIVHDPFECDNEYGSKFAEQIKDIGSRNAYMLSLKAIFLVGQYMEHLKQIGVYNNSRIIIVADHGCQIFKDLPGYNTFAESTAASVNPILLFKDFDEEGDIKTDNTFMTNADTPVLATQNLIENARNPFTGVPLQMHKANGADIYMSHNFWNARHFTGSAAILDESPDFMHVNTEKTGNILDQKSWITDVDYNKLKDNTKKIQ